MAGRNRAVLLVAGWVGLVGGTTIPRLPSHLTTEEDVSVFLTCNHSDRIAWKYIILNLHFPFNPKLIMTLEFSIVRTVRF